MSRANSARLDRDLVDLPEGMRWREWMLRVEAATSSRRNPFPARRSPGSSATPAGWTRSSATSMMSSKRGLARRLFARGWQFRTRPRLAETLRALRGHEKRRPAVLHQTRNGGALGRRLSAASHPRRALASRRPRHQPRHPRPVEEPRRHGARPPRPSARRADRLVTTARFLEMFAFGSLRDLRDLAPARFRISPSDRPV